MKKFWMYLLIISIVITGLTGCAERKKTEMTEKGSVIVSESSPSPAPVPTATPAASFAPSPAASALPGKYPMDFVFSSGAGGWSTTLTLQSDGSFTGEYHDSEMGDSGEEYPNGSFYICKFSGQFTSIKQLDKNTFSMQATYAPLAGSPETPWIEDGVRYIPADPYGLTDGKEFIFYTPDKPLDALDEEFLSWWPLRYSEESAMMTTLSCYGIYNTATGDGFFSS